MREEITVILETGSEIREGGFLGQPQSVRAWPAKLQEGCLADWPFEFRATVQPSLPPSCAKHRRKSSEIPIYREPIPSGQRKAASSRLRGIVSPSISSLPFRFPLSFLSIKKFSPRALKPVHGERHG